MPPSTQELNREVAYLLNNICVVVENLSVDNTTISGNSIISMVEDATDDSTAGKVSV